MLLLLFCILSVFDNPSDLNLDLAHLLLEELLPVVSSGSPRESLSRFLLDQEHFFFSNKICLLLVQRAAIRLQLISLESQLPKLLIQGKHALLDTLYLSLIGVVEIVE